MMAAGGTDRVAGEGDLTRMCETRCGLRWVSTGQSEPCLPSFGPSRHTADNEHPADHGPFFHLIRRYSNREVYSDSDSDGMEVSYEEAAREERRSAAIAKKEDEEAFREEEKRRKEKERRRKAEGGR